MINSVSEYKEFLEIDISNPSEDELVEDYALEVESWVKEYLGRDIETASYTEYYDGDGTHYLLTKQFPVTSVTSIKYYEGLDSNNAVIWTAYVQGDDYDRLMILEECKLYFDTIVFPKGTQNLQVVYAAGYSSTTMPKEIKMRCKELMKLYYDEFKGARSLGVSSVTKTGGGINDVTSLDKEEVNKILRHLSKYRNLNV